MPSVAIITARSPQGTQGGAERLYEGLLEAFRGAGWDADEIPIMFDESSNETILAGYEEAKKLNVLMYDLVISTKAPTYCVWHPNHAVWLIHTIRVFYDRFEDISHNPWADTMRKTIHDIDNAALRQPGLRRFSIGATVSERLETFNGLAAKALHPPHPKSELFTSSIQALEGRAQVPYFFTASRLHAWKRLDLIVQAKKMMSQKARLIIAGEGPELNALRQLSDGVDDIEFVGHVDEQRLAELYAGALAVPFVPASEDYGYVTIEAFFKGVPVITVSDSGEPAAIVASTGGGIVTDTHPEAIASALDRICLDGPYRQKMGAAGRRWVEKLSWTKITDALSKN